MYENVCSKIVVIGEKWDGHLPFVEHHLLEPLIVIDMVAIIAGEELSYSLHQGELRLIYKGKTLEEVTSVWVRGRRIVPILPVPVVPAYQAYARSAVSRHVEALYVHFKKARWVSDYYAIRRAEHKPRQLQLAARLGLRVPETLFTSNPDRARRFIGDHSVVITKPISTDFPRNKEKGVGSVFFATKVRRNQKVNLAGLPLAPAIFQQAIDAAADLRVTVIGDKIFPAIITDEKLDRNSSVRDWRIAHEKGKLHIEPYQLPPEIADKCITLVKELGLEFGAIDLVLDKKNRIWFLEINPNGQWAFVEEATGQPMGKALAELLQNKK